MTMTKSTFAKLLEPTLRKVFFDSYDEIPEQYSQVYNVKTSKKSSEHDFHVSGLGMWGTFGAGPVAYEDMGAGLQVDYTHTTFSKGIEIPIELAEDDLYDVIGPNGAGTKRSAALGRGARARVETDSADVLNNGFATNGFDGVPLFSTAHPNTATGGVSGTQSNLLGTTALATQSLQDARVLLRKQQDAKGVKIQAMGDILIVPAELEYLALELVQSELKPQTANNDINVVGKKVKKVVVMDYLTDVNNWFLADSTLHQLNFFWRVRPEFRNFEDINNFKIQYTGRMRFSVGYSDWRGIVGSNP